MPLHQGLCSACFDSKSRPRGTGEVGVFACVILAALAVNGCCGGGRGREPAPESQPAPSAGPAQGQGIAPEPNQPAASSGQSLAPAQDQPLNTETKVGDFRVTVHGSASKSSTNRGLAKYHAGTNATLHIVDFTVTNDFNRAVVLATRVWLKDSTDRRFQATPACQFATPDAIGRLDEINPGLSRRGRMCFEIPANASGLKFVFRDGLKTVPFAL